MYNFLKNNFHIFKFKSKRIIEALGFKIYFNPQKGSVMSPLGQYSPLTPFYLIQKPPPKKNVDSPPPRAHLVNRKILYLEDSFISLKSC